MHAIAIPPIALTDVAGRPHSAGTFGESLAAMTDACRKPGKRHGVVPHLARTVVQRELAGWRVTRQVPRSCRTPSSHVDVNVPSIIRFCASPRNVADAWQLRSGSQYDAIVPLI